MISSRGKKQDVSLRGSIRIEHDNDRIVYTGESGGVIRIDEGTNTQFFDPTTGGKVMQLGKLPDGRYGVSWFDPDTGREFMRSGVLPNDVAGMAVSKEGVDLPDAFQP